MKHFEKAVPVWVKGYETEKNIMCGFRTLIIGSGRAMLRITGSSVYRVFVNGNFAAYGPARTAHGFYRVDEIDLAPFIRSGENLIAVEAAGYNVNSFYLLDQPAFLQAEVLVGGGIFSWTEPHGKTFPGHILKSRIRKVQRYSFQRPFAEAYRLSEYTDIWRTDSAAAFEGDALVQTEEKELLDRGVPYPQYDRLDAWQIAGFGTVESGEELAEYRRDRSLTDISGVLKGFAMEDLEICLTDEAQRLRFNSSGFDRAVQFPSDIKAERYTTYDFGINTTGFLGLNISCAKDAEIYLLFDEVLTDGDIDFLRMECANVVKYKLTGGEYRLLTFEPYTLRYLKLVVLGADCRVTEAYVIGYRSGSKIMAEYYTEDIQLKAVYEAAIDTFLQNTVDCYMDCPSRERAGWLCDSFFIARVERLLTGGSVTERNFLENYMLPETFEYLPDGMLPMCYPSDHYNGQFIPNWAMWFVLQLEEFAQREPESDMPRKLHDKVYRLLDYFKPFENENGLLESLESWVFVEWSKANDFVQDVNYPTNMLYAAAIAAAGRIYCDKSLINKAETIREQVRKLSYDGLFFTDNAVRKDGKLQNTGEKTEVCQYYAFFLGIASKETHPELWRVLFEKFGPLRKQTDEYPDVAFANAFIGNYMRLDIMLQNGLSEQMIREMRDYFYYMAEKTGTLWEHDSTTASCNHGFASYAAYLLLNA